MHDEFHRLSSNLSPIGLAASLGLNPQLSVDGKYHVVVMADRSFSIDSYGFVSDNPHDGFMAGGVMDFAALYASKHRGTKGRASFVEGSKIIINCLADQHPDLILSIGKISDKAADSALVRRKLFDFLKKKSMTCRDATYDQIACFGVVKDLGVDQDMIPGSVCAMTYKDLLELLNKIKDIGITVRGSFHNQGHVVIPYFNDYGIPAALKVISYSDKRSRKTVVNTIELKDSKVAFSNFLSRHPGDRVFLHTSGIAAAKINSDLHRDNAHAVCMGVHTNLSYTRIGWMPVSATFVDDGNLDMVAPSVLDVEGVVVNVTTPLTGVGSVERASHTHWHEQVLSRLQKLLSDSAVTVDNAELRMTLEMCRNNMGLRYAVLGRLRAEGRIDILQSAESMFFDGLVINKSNINIYKTTQGYSCCYPNLGEDGPLYEVSNFTLDMVSNVNFPEDANFYHRVSIRDCSQNSYEALILSTDFESTKKLDRAVKQGSLGLNVSQAPVITDLNSARYLIPFWRSMTSKLPRETGISFLGWDNFKNRFYGPNFEVHFDGIVNTELKIKHPTSRMLKFFGSPEASPAKCKELPADLADVVSISAAMIARQQLGYLVKSIPVVNHSRSQHVLQKLFSAVGQHTAIELNSNDRSIKEFPGLRGWPGYGVGFTSGQIRSSTLPLFILCDHGMRLQDEYSDDDLSRAGDMLAWLIPRIALRMVKGEPFEKQYSILYETELAREGAKLVCEIARLSSWPINQTQFEAVEKVLRGIAASEVPMFFDHDLAAQKVYFHYKKIKGKVDMDEFMMQLSEVVNELEIHDGYLSLDAVSAVGLINTFYQGEAQPRPVNLPVLDRAEQR